MTGADAAAVLRAGATAVALGTAFLDCPEAGTAPVHRHALTHRTRHHRDPRVHRSQCARPDHDVDRAVHRSRARGIPARPPPHGARCGRTARPPGRPSWSTSGRAPATRACAAACRRAGAPPASTSSPDARRKRDEGLSVIIGSVGDRDRDARRDPAERDRADQDVRGVHGRRRHRLRGAQGRVLRVPRAQRRRQVLHDAHGRLRVTGDQRRAAAVRARPGRRRPRDPRPARQLPAARHPRRGAHRRGEPLDLRPLLRPVPQGGPRAGGRAARLRPAHRPRQGQGRAAVRGHEAPPDDRPVADQLTRDPAARRADHRARPAGPTCVVGQAVPAQAVGGHPRPDHALHGRGRAALRPARRDGPRADRRRGVAALAHRRVLHARGARAALRRRGPQGRRRAGRRRSASGSRCCPTGCSSTPTTATRPRRSCTPAGIEPLSSLVRRATLEDVFLHLTGRTLVD